MLLFIPNTSESVHVCYVSEFRAGGLELVVRPSHLFFTHFTLQSAVKSSVTENSQVKCQQFVVLFLCCGVH